MAAAEPGPSTTVTWGRLGFLALAFFAGMTAMEVVLEGAMRTCGKENRSLVGMLVTWSQFAGCFLLALASGGATLSEAGGRTEALSRWGGVRASAQAWVPYIWLSVLVWGGTGLSNVAVAWVQYPVKVVFKSSKLIPTMAVSVVMQNSRPFRWAEYVAAIFLCAGAAFFSFKAGQTDASGLLIALGIAFLGSSVMCDAMSSNTQQRLMQKSHVPPLIMMMWLNFCGMAISVIIIACSGKLHSAVKLLGQQPSIIGYMAGVGGCIAVGVWANTQLIHESGSVVAVGVATVRKMVTMILSYIIYPKPFGWMHALGAILMVLGLIMAELVRKPLQAKSDPEREKLLKDDCGKSVRSVPPMPGHAARDAEAAQKLV